MGFKKLIIDGEKWVWNEVERKLKLQSQPEEKN